MSAKSTQEVCCDDQDEAAVGLDRGVEALAQLRRRHWTIEKRSHSVRDEVFGHDRCRIRTGTAPQAPAALRNGLLALIRSQDWETTPDALRHYAASLHKALQTLGLDAALTVLISCKTIDITSYLC